MKKLILKELTILSLIEKSATKITFDSHINVICGDNDTGKSSLIKSIYYSLGASPNQIHPEWLQIKPITIVSFENDGNDYTMFRYENYIVLFDEKLEIIETFSSVGNELAPFYEDFFDFKLKMKHSTSGALKTPLPDHYFLPFYIDQDTGWNKNWNSFSRLREFKNWRKDIIEYHTGIKPNEYYILKAEKATLMEEKREAEQELSALEKIYLRALKQKNNSISLNVDINKFETEITMLVNKLNELKEVENKYREKILDLNNEKAIIEKQIKMAEDTRNQLNKDIDFAEELDEEIECPICGTIHKNTFSERYIIAQDENHCYELLLQLTEERNQIQKKIDKENEQLQEHSTKKKEIEDILSQKKGEIKFNDYIENVGQTKLVGTMQDEIVSSRSDIASKEEDINSKSKAMRKYVDGDLKNEIEGDYLKFMKSFLFNLNVHKLKEVDYASISSQIKENGSDLSRALLAYFYSVLLVMEKHSSTYKCPIIIDSPLQNEQDDTNSVKILEFIKKKTPKSYQLILGCVDLHGVEFEGKKIALTDKFHLLNKSKYEELFNEHRDIIEKAMSIGEM